MATDLLKELNDVQRQAVENTEGPVMIIAGAGSGKTRVLTYRLAHILQQRKADAFELLALTFTNKAAREMRNRIEQLVGSDARNIFMGTFHSIFSRILRIEADKIGFTSSFTIYDEDDAVSLIKTIIKELQLDDKKYKPKSIKNNISGAKNKLVDPKTYLATYATDDFTKVVGQVYPIYQGRMQKANAMDFDDLLVYTAVLFKSNPQVLEKYQRRFKYILVDEYQDTNHAQYVITRALADGHHNICVVGDDAQSIYSFRGATIENILNFQKHYPNTKVFKLEQNYRSTGTIVNAANQIIKENKDQLQKEVFTKNPDGDLIRLIRAENELQEGDKIVDTIREQKQRHSYYNRDFAVLYRTNAQSRTIEDALRKAGIAYKIFGGLSFYKRKEIKDVVAYLRLAINPNDEEALKRVINYPARAIGETSISKILALANENKVTAWDVVRNIMLYNIGRSAKAINDFATLILSFQKISETSNAHQAVAHIAKFSGIQQELHRENQIEGVSRWENIQELVNASREFMDDPMREEKTLEAFLNEISLLTDADEKTNTDDYVTLMTIHASKGLEFKSVFVSGLEEGLFPSGMSMNSRAEIEEERRLFYVAITRAEHHLTLSYAKMRSRFGTAEFPEISRFVDEIDRAYFQSETKHRLDNLFQANTPNGSAPSRASGDRPGAAAGQIRPLKPVATLNLQTEDAFANFEGDDLQSLSIGAKVEHAKFGVGLVYDIEGTGGERRASIDFKLKGKKTLILKYAKLKILG